MQSMRGSNLRKRRKVEVSLDCKTKQSTLTAFLSCQKSSKDVKSVSDLDSSSKAFAKCLIDEANKNVDMCKMQESAVDETTRGNVPTSIIKPVITGKESCKSAGKCSETYFPDCDSRIENLWDNKVISKSNLQDENNSPNIKMQPTLSHETISGNVPAVRNEIFSDRGTKNVPSLTAQLSSAAPVGDNESTAKLNVEVVSSSGSPLKDVMPSTSSTKDMNDNSATKHIIQDEASFSKNSNYFDMSFSWMSELEMEKLDISNCDPVNMDNISCDEKSSSDNVKYKVLEVKRFPVQNELQLILDSSESMSSGFKQCCLRGFWADTVINVGDSLHVLAPFISNCAVVDDSSGFVVVNPDLLISSTAVVSTLFCMRKAALSLKFRNWDGSNRAMLVGSLVHQLFQQAVNEHKIAENEIKAILLRIMKHPGNLILMYCQNITEEKMMEAVLPYIPHISEWISRHCVQRNSFSLSQDLKVTEVRDIEDNLWCPRYGIKGKIDLTVKVECSNSSKSQLMPLELKTGTPSFSAEHQGQVNLYTLMLKDRTNELSNGLLLYLKGGVQMKEILADHKAQRGLIQLRNDLAHYTSSWNDKQMLISSPSKEYNSANCYLPDPINSKRLCQKCSYLFPCTIFQRAYTGKALDSSHAMSSFIPQETRHLSEDHLEYFRHWTYLLYLESTSSESGKCFWREDALTCEKNGFCFSNMVLRSDTLTQQSKEGEAFIHTFFRSEESPVKSELDNIGLKPGDYLVISNQRNNLEVGLATGYVVSIAKTHVEVAVERNIQELSRYEGYLFRLDKPVSSAARSTSFSNLVKLMVPEESQCRLRELIINRKSPDFVMAMSKSIAVRARPILKSLNKLQRKAIFKALMAKDYMLLKGMPGTGKTATIVAMVRLLVEEGHRVLVTSHTHSAVDNILIRLQQHNVSILRMGQLSRIHPDVHSASFEAITKELTRVDELSALIKSKMVIGTTCLGVHHPVLQNMKFDICIVDEASQITQPDCIGPLYYAKKFILAGDPMQLPPVVVNEKARLKGMQESLFSRLESSTNCMELVLQYRMNREIMRLCSELAYGGLLKCGSEEIETSVLEFSEPTSQEILTSMKGTWLASALNCQLKYSALFVNTDGLPDDESDENFGKISNTTENKLIFLLTKYLLKLGVMPGDIGIIAPYRRQVELISKTLAAADASSIEVNSVDQYQGKDKDVILVSCVRSQTAQTTEKKNLTILSDVRRLNVAISRAKKKLIIIGSRSTLMQYDCFQKLLGLLRPDQMLVPDVKDIINHDFKKPSKSQF